jgi:diphthine-ammonia ligase
LIYARIPPLITQSSPLFGSAKKQTKIEKPHSQNFPVTFIASTKENTQYLHLYMKLVGLISGGKDSIFNLIKCVEYGHELICLANLYPPPIEKTDELNSHMFQTVGHEIVELIAKAMNLPLIRLPLAGKSLITSLHYETINNNDNNDNCEEYDEIEDLYTLLLNVKKAFPDVQGVACGAILSNYQRIRVERIASRLGLTCYGYLWQRDQVELLKEMCTVVEKDEVKSTQIDPVLIKLATPNLPPKENLLKTLQDLEPTFLKLYSEYGMNVCGEGGEYESLVLDSCLQESRIKITNYEILSQGDITSDGKELLHLTVPYIHIIDSELCPKTQHEIDAVRSKALLTIPKINLNCEEFSLKLGPTTIHPSLTPCKCHSENNIIAPTPAFNTTTIPLLPLQTQLDNNLSHITNLTPQLLTRCFFQSQNLTELFSTVINFGHKTYEQYGIKIRPTFVMICIPDMAHFAAMNKQYSSVFPSIRPPARVCLQSTLPYYTIDVIWITTDVNTAIHQNTHNIIQKLTQNTSSCHVEGISTWAPANIGPYSQYWRFNGIFIGAGQIGMFPPTMALYTCPRKQFLQTIKNTVACFQSASEIHQVNAVNYVMKKPPTVSNVSSFGQFTSFLLTFDERLISQCLFSIFHTHPNPTLSLLQKVELLLTIINTLTSVPSTPVHSPTTDFEPIPIPSISTIVSNPDQNPNNLPKFKSFGTLLNLTKETHHSIPLGKKDEICAILKYLKSPSPQNYYIPPIITNFDSDCSSIKGNLDDGVGEYGDDDDNDDDDEEEEQYLTSNSNPLMLFVPAAMLPRGAVFELCSVGITAHVFKAMAKRNSKLFGNGVSVIRWVCPAQNLSTCENHETSDVFVIFGIFIAGLYLDFAVFHLTSNGQLELPLTSIPDEILDQIYQSTSCYPKGHRQHQGKNGQNGQNGQNDQNDQNDEKRINPIPSLDYIQSQLLVPMNDIVKSGPLVPSPNLTTNIYPTTQVFDQLNAIIAEIHFENYFKLLLHKSPQFNAIFEFIQENPDITNIDDSSLENIYYPRPNKNHKNQCLCQYLNQDERIETELCTICMLLKRFSNDICTRQIYHAVLGNPDLLTDQDFPQDD